MYSTKGRGCEIPEIYWLSRLASPLFSGSGGYGRSVAPSCGLTSITEKFWIGMSKHSWKSVRSEKLAL